MGFVVPLSAFLFLMLTVLLFTQYVFIQDLLV